MGGVHQRDYRSRRCRGAGPTTTHRRRSMPRSATSGENDVVGDIQGEYDRAWAAVASTFKNDPWVVGYDPINEPFTTTLDQLTPEALDVRLECFYTGRAAPGHLLDSTKTLTLPADDPAQGPHSDACAPQIPTT